ncbi:unnamed protein product [Effrenium voratum]|nr:unnamed protein product [Effrenium voratum]
MVHAPGQFPTLRNALPTLRVAGARAPSASACYAMHERLYVAGIGHKRVLKGDPDAIRTAYHNLDQARSLMEEMNKKEAQRLMDCMSPESQAEFSKNMTQIGSLLVGAHSHDPLLAMRAGLERLADSLARLLHHLRRCNANAQLWPDFEAMVAQLHRLVAAGRLNDGFCPFTGTRQTTIGGAEVGEVLHGRRLEMTSEGLARLFGRILRLVRAHGDDPDPPGAVPVNWEMRKMMFGGASKDLQSADGDGTLSLKELEELKAANPGLAEVDLKQLDADGDGKISREEVEAAMDWDSVATPTPVATPREGGEADTPRSAVKAMASAASAASDKSESRSALQQRRKAREQRRKEVMNVMDADGDGVITKTELDQLKATNPELAKVDMSKLDTDGDGQISKEELEKAMDWDGDAPQADAEAASIFSAVVNIFGGASASQEEGKQVEEVKESKEEAKEADKKEPDDKEAPPLPKAKALPKALFAMTKVNFVAGRFSSHLSH